MAMAAGRDTDRRIVAAILLLAFGLRLPFALFDFFHHPDEIWQYLEPAYRLDFGRSITTWEYRAGIRGWLIPAALAPPLWLGETLFGGLGVPMLPVRLCLIALSLLIVWAAMRIGRQVSRMHAIVGGLVMATAFEPLFLSARSLSEPIATALLAGAAAPLLDDDRRDRSRLIAGMLLALAVSCRLQLAPAAVMLTLLTCRLDRRMWLGVIGGGIVGLALGALGDALNGEVPLRWMLENYRLNLVEHVSARYGVEPPLWYVGALLRSFGPVAPAIAAFIVVGTRRQPVLTIVALVHLLVHSLIPHKEFRFVYPSVVLLLMVGALGSADIVQWLAARRAGWRRPACVLIGAVWLGAGAAGAANMARDGRMHGHQLIAAWRALHAAPGLCGIASLDEVTPMAYSQIDRDVPVYMFAEAGSARTAVAHAAAYDMILAGGDRAALLAPAGFRLQQCFATRQEGAAAPALCLFRRPGSCAPAGHARYLENAVRARLGT